MATMAEGRILIADDEDGLRWVLEKGFRGAGYQVTAVKDGTAALREAEAQPFDLVLLGIRMPGMDGLPLLGHVRGKRPGAQVVIMTAHGTVETAIQAMQKGASDYPPNPLDMADAFRVARFGGAGRAAAGPRPCRRSTRRSAASRRAMSPCSSAASQERARRSWRGRCTTTAGGPAGPSSASRPRPSR